MPDLQLIALNGVNAYLWTGTGGPTLIDTGLPWSSRTLLQEMASVDIHPKDLQSIIITHADIDHVGGLPVILGEHQTPICCHAVEKAYVKGLKVKRPNPSLAGYLIRPAVLLLNRRYKPDPIEIDTLVIQGQVLPGGFAVLHMPGHSPGQIALFHAERKLLITGDALSNRDGKLRMPPKLFTPDYAQTVDSLDKLRTLDYEIICFGHGPPILSDAKNTVNTFIQLLNE